jgi:hypothetical protein
LPPASIYTGEDLQRQVFYRGREDDAEKLVAAAQALLPRITAAQASMQELLHAADFELNFLTEAARVLLSARQVLRWSWVHAYYHTGASCAGLSLALAQEAQESPGDAETGAQRKKLRVSALDDGGVVVPPGAPSEGADSTGTAVVEAPVLSLEAMASRHASLRVPLHALRLFESRQGHLEGFAETLGGLLDIDRIEKSVIANLRACSESVRAAFVLGEKIRGFVRFGDGPREVAASELARSFEGGLPALRSKLSLFTAGVVRSLDALTVDDLDLLEAVHPP